MGNQIGYYNGSEGSWPRRTVRKLPGQSLPTHSMSFQDAPNARCDMFWHFNGAPSYYEITAPLISNDTNVNGNMVPVTDTKISRATVQVPRAGVLVAADVVGEDTLAANSGTNYVTFSVTNKGGGGALSTAMLAVSDANTTKQTTGAAWTANIPRALTIHGTAANLNVAEGDVIIVQALVAGTLDNVVDQPRVRLRFQTLPNDLYPRITRTAGLVGVVPVASGINGTVQLVPTTTSETQVVGIDFGDQLCIQGNKAPLFQCRMKIGTADVGANQNMVFGLGSAYNATPDSVTYNAWFKLATSMVLRVEDDDNSTDTDDTSTGQTLVNGTYYVFTVDCCEPGYVSYYLGDSPQNLLVRRALNLGANGLQPTIMFYKTSNTAVPIPEIDYIRCSWDIL